MIDTQEIGREALRKTKEARVVPQLTLERHRFELHVSTYTWIFFHVTTVQWTHAVVLTAVQTLIVQGSALWLGIHMC